MGFERDGHPDQRPVTWDRAASGAPRRAPGPPTDDVHAWLLGLPWVIERPYSLDTPGVRTFAVDCEPLGRRAMWLVSGLGDGAGVSVILPAEVADRFEALGLVTWSAPMPPEHVLASIADGVDDADFDRVVLEAYSHAVG